jgi:hypothetical protein
LDLGKVRRYRNLVSEISNSVRESLEEKRQLGRPSRKWKENIIGDLKEIVCGYVFGIHLAHDR